MRRHFAIALFVCALVSSAPAQVFTDDFDDGVLDPAKWTPSESFANSRVGESGGVLQLENTGIVTAVPDVGPCVLSCRFTFTGSRWDHLDLLLRSDGTLGGRFGRPQNGILVAIRPSDNPDAAEVYVGDWGAVLALDQAPTPFPILLNQEYLVELKDDGASVSVTINDVLILSQATTADYGDKIHLANGNKPGYQCTLDVDWIEIVQEVVDIKANGSDDLVVLGGGEWLTVTADLVADPAVVGDTWILALTSATFPFSVFSYNLDRGSWAPWLFTFNGPSAQGAIPQLENRALLQSNGLPNGFYTFYLGYDSIQNRRIDFGAFEIDAVSVIIGD